MARTLAGRRIAITGASSGIGFAAARAFASAGAEVIMVARDNEKSRSAAASLESRSVILLTADLSLQSECHRLAGAIEASGPLDVLINNAGVQRWHREETLEGIEMTFAVNVIAPLLLTQLLLPCIKASALRTVLATGSIVHRWGPIDLSDLQATQNYDPQRVYACSKAALLLNQFAIADALTSEGVAIHTLEPGMTKTAFARDFSGFSWLMSRFWRPLMRDPAEIGREFVALAGRDDLLKPNGGYWRGNGPGRRSAQVQDRQLAEMLHAACRSLLIAPPAPKTQEAAAPR